MLIEFKDVQIEVSGLPIMVKSANLSYTSNIEHVYGVGYRGCVGYNMNGTPTNNLNLNYIMEISNDPNFSSVHNFVENYHLSNFQGINIVAGNISGTYYPIKYTINFDSNNGILDTSIDYENYYQTSGNLNTGQSLFYNTSSNDDIAHVWTSSLNIDQEPLLNLHIIGFNYNCLLNWEPTYSIGQNKPVSVDLIGGRQTLSLILKNLNTINFTGMNFKEYFNKNNITIDIKPINALFNNNTNQLSIRGLSSGYINNYEINMQENDFVRIKMDIYKDF